MAIILRRFVRNQYFRTEKNYLIVIYSFFLINLCLISMTRIPDHNSWTILAESNNTSLESDSQKNRLLCWIIISSDDTNASWRKDCDDSIFLLDKKNKKKFFHSKNHFIHVPNHKESDKLWLQTSTSIRLIYKYYLSSFDWFLIVNDDTDVDIAKLRKFLHKFDSQVPQYFSYTWPGLMNSGHRGSFVLSRKAVRWLEEVGLQNESLCSGRYLGSERIRSCMQKLGVFSGIDARLHQCFIPHNVREQQNSSTKLILAWNTLIGQDLAVLAAGQSTLCPVKCQLSSNNSLYAKADAIIFYAHLADSEPLSTLPIRRFPWQRYIFLSTEAAVYGLPRLPLFNWSMTYQRDSDIRSDYYGQLIAFTPSTSEADFVYRTAKNKNRMLVWLASNCQSNSLRENYVQELMNYIDVDVFGYCGIALKNVSNACPRTAHYGSWCNNIPFTKEYRFYISFENTVCRDYVTEKFYQALDHYMVPIVLRKADYVDIAPEGSFIAADQFRSPKQLAQYLHYLASNFEEYFKYFEWTKTNRVVWKEKEVLEDAMCRLCRMLHENRTVNLGKDMQGDWEYNKECISRFVKQLL